jgi:hypothetical protein
MIGKLRLLALCVVLCLTLVAAGQKSSLKPEPAHCWCKAQQRSLAHAHAISSCNL